MGLKEGCMKKILDIKWESDKKAIKETILEVLIKTEYENGMKIHWAKATEINKEVK